MKKLQRYSAGPTGMKKCDEGNWCYAPDVAALSIYQQAIDETADIERQELVKMCGDYGRCSPGIVERELARRVRRRTGG